MELEDGRFPPAPDSPGAHTPLTVAWMLHPDEQVLWVGRPSTWWRTLQPTDKWSISNGLAWLAGPPLIWLAIFGGKIPTLLLIFSLAVLVYCFWSVVSRRLSWRKVTYVLTDQRAFIVEERHYLSRRTKKGRPRRGRTGRSNRKRLLLSLFRISIGQQVLR